MGSPMESGRGRQKKAISETIKKDLEVNHISINMIPNRTSWHHLIPVTVLTWWEKN